MKHPSLSLWVMYSHIMSEWKSAEGRLGGQYDLSTGVRLPRGKPCVSLKHSLGY